MSQATLFDKIWDLHTVGTLETGETQLFIGLHLVHEVTSPQAFQMLEERGLPVLHPERTFATVDHIVPTDRQVRPLSDPLAEEMYQALERNVAEHGIAFFGLDSEYQGIVHVIGPELGLTQPGMTIACGDSHTSTHGAFGTIAFGIGTSQVRDVLATQTLAVTKPKVRRIRVDGALGPGVYAKDIILSIIATLGVKGGIGYAYEYAGCAIDALSMDERMSICNMSIEGGARVGYVNPDRITADYVRGRPYAPADDSLERAEEVLALDRLSRRCQLRRRGGAACRTRSSRWSPGASTRASRWACRTGCRGSARCPRTSRTRPPRPTGTWD